MPTIRFTYRLSKTKDSRLSAGGYVVKLLLQRPGSPCEPRDKRDFDKLPHRGEFRLTLPVSDLQGTDVLLEIRRRDQSGGYLRTKHFRMNVRATSSLTEVPLGRFRFFDQIWKVSGEVIPFPDSELHLELLSVRLEARSGPQFEEPASIGVNPDGTFAFDGPRMFLDPEKTGEDILRVFTQAGIDVGRHFSASQPGRDKRVRVHVGRPFLDVWGEFRSRHPLLASKLEKIDHNPKKAHRGDDTFLAFRRYDRKWPYQVAEGVVTRAKPGPPGDPDWVWNIKLDRFYDSDEGFRLPNEKNRIKHGGLHVEACRSLSRERIADGLEADAANVPLGAHVWMLGSYVFDDTWDFGMPDHEHYELHPLYVMRPCRGGWFHFVVHESIALAKEASRPGLGDAGDRWPRTSTEASDYVAFYEQADPKDRSDPQDWSEYVATTYRLIYERYREAGDDAGLARFFAKTSIRHDSLGVASGLPGSPAEAGYRRWARDRFRADRAHQVRDALIERLLSLFWFLYGTPSFAGDPVKGPAPQSLLRCLYAQQQQWAAVKTAGAVGEPNPRISLNRATARRTEVVRAELPPLYRGVFASAASDAERGALFAEAVLSYRQWAVKETGATAGLTEAKLRLFGEARQPPALARQVKAQLDCFWDELTPHSAK